VAGTRVSSGAGVRAGRAYISRNGPGASVAGRIFYVLARRVTANRAEESEETVR